MHIRNSKNVDTYTDEKINYEITSPLYDVYIILFSFHFLWYVHINFDMTYLLNVGGITSILNTGFKFVVMVEYCVFVGGFGQ